MASTSPTTTSNANTSTANPISLASIQAEQTRLESSSATKTQGATMSQKISQTPPKLTSKPTANDQQKHQMSWAAWGNSSATSNATNTKAATNSDFSLSQSLNGPTPVAASSVASNQSVANSSNSNANANSNNAGFWGDVNETKKTNSNGNKSHANSNSNSKKYQKIVVIIMILKK